MRQTITSQHNPLIKYLHTLYRHDVRKREQKILVEGLRAFISAVEYSVPFETALYAPERLRSDAAIAALEKAQQTGAEVVTAAPDVLDALSSRETSQGIIAVAKRPRHTLEDIEFDSESLFLVMYEPQDPSNIGAMLRSADGAGIKTAIIVGKTPADLFDPKSIRASLGTCFSLKTVESKDTESVIQFLQRHGVSVIGSSDKAASFIWHIHLADPIAILVGNERAGAPEELLRMCDVTAKLPMLGAADSLNVAAAATALLYEAVRQRKSTPQHSPRVMD